ncbi:MAG TPA: hypothetical protein DCE09_09065 [Thermoanaerobacter sp.]|nr:hypothetical protein [Thermoanaerobacter sp.]
MKRMRYFLLTVLMVGSLILASCSNEYANLEKYQFTKNSDLKLVYADEKKVIIEDGENLVLESKGNFYKLPTKVDLRKDEIIILLSTEGNYALTGKIDKDKFYDVNIVNLIKGNKLAVEYSAVKYMISSQYSLLPNEQYFAYVDKDEKDSDMTIKMVDLTTFKTYDVKVDMPVTNVIAVKNDSGYQIYFESLGKVYKKLNEGKPTFIANGYLLYVDENGNIYLYRNINIKTTKVYKIDKNKNEKEIASLDKPSLLVRKNGDVAAFITANDEEFKSYDMDLINLKTSKHTVISNASENLNYDIPLFYKRGNIAVIFYKEGKAEMIDTKNGNTMALKNFEKYVFPNSNMEFGFNIYENQTIGFNKIVQLKKQENSVKLLLVDANNKVLKTIAEQQLK